MSAVRRWFQLDARRRWRSLLVLALLVGFSTGTVMTAVAGARRGASVWDRLLDRTLPATIVVLPNEPGFDWEPIRALPEVEALTGFAVSEFTIDGVPPDDYADAFPETDTQVFNTIERPVMLEGRMLDPSRSDEVMATRGFLSHYGYRVGDKITLRLYSPEQIDVAMEGTPAAPAGPAIEATIVGVPRSMWYLDRPGEGPGAIIPSPGLFATYPDNFLGAGGDAGYVNALVRLRGGAADIGRFKDDLARITGRDDIDVWDQTAAAAHYRSVTGFEASSLLVFALAAAVAAVLLVGQTVVRYSTSTVGDLQPLRAVGMTPREMRWAVLLGPTVAGVAGSLLGATAAIVASRWFPVGSASVAEPTPGLQADFVVLGLGVVVAPLLVAAGSMMVATFALRSGGVAAPRRSLAAAAAVRAGLPVPVAVGTRFALEPGRGRAAVPVRPALFGAVVGVLGLLAAFTFAAGIHDAVSHLERFGYTYDLATFLGYNGDDFVPPDQVLPIIGSDADVAAVNDARMDVAQAEGAAISVFTLDPVDRPIDLVVTEGRLPNGPGEIALGPRTADEAGLEVGDTGPFTGTLGTQQLTVTGIAFVFPGPHNDYATGGWITSDTYESLFDGFKFHFVLVGLRDGADPTAVAERLGAAALPGPPDASGNPSEMHLEFGPPDPPTEVQELLQVQAVPLFLAAFLLLLALGAVGHALATAVRRRSHDVAVLRAVGMTRRQSRGIVVTQATLLAAIGLVAGIPLGVALGRTVWRYVADQTPVFYVAPAVWLALAAAIPLALVAANLLAIWPSRRAARLRLGEVLRAE